MQLNGLLERLRTDGRYRETRAALDTPQTALNVIHAAHPFFVAALHQDIKQPIIYITAKIKRAYDVSEQMPVWLGADVPVLRFNEPSPKFYQHAPWGDSAARGRLETLAALHAPQTLAAHPIVVTSAHALMPKTMPFHLFRRSSITLNAGERADINRLLQQLVDIGYESASQVLDVGTFSRRGSIVDVYPLDANTPIRIDFFGDEIDSLRTFDPSTQQSQGGERLTTLIIPPAREVLPTQAKTLTSRLSAWFDALPDEVDIRKDALPLSEGVPFTHLEFYGAYLYTQPITLLHYAPDALVIVEDMDALRATFDETIEAAELTRQALIAEGRLPQDYPIPYVTWAEFEESLHEHSVVTFSTQSPSLGGLFTPEERFGGQVKNVIAQLTRTQRNNESAVVISQQTARLTDLWRERSAEQHVPIAQSMETLPNAGDVIFVHGGLHEGFTLNTTPRLHVITDAELFGWSRPEPRRRPTKKVARLPESDYGEWGEGEFIVHVDYGIGRFLGMRKQTIDGVEREYLVIEYGGNDTLYVPIHQADRLTRYIGADDTPPTLNRIGKADWDTVRNRVKKAVEEDARELLELYASRAKSEGFAFATDDHWQHELEASFAYVETDDQLRALREIKKDMEQPIPMDRLICGDVGYGKTEVALRAAFKAANNSKQVAVLVPTTLLAQQHYETFRARLSPFGVRVELMSRFRSGEEQNRVLPKIASGEVDILIGTHRILSSDITIPNLGLVIIDEEQRFGVKQKEHFKHLRTQVDVLTLTATPIPRTLYMSLVGVRDISMIQTPPEERLPVITHVGPFNAQLVRQAVLRELERGGQVFVVHNRVKTIDMVREQLEEIVPEARVITGHGQMNERHLEGVMGAFGRGEYDILLSTAIVENGIDIPNANTLIVDRADWFGLSQLYQLRGRVGRGAQQAYAFFFHHASGRLNEEARERLHTLAENTHLGAGYQIAMRDLEIRGAGDILSTRQTGHVQAVGLNLYVQLLSQAVQHLKGEKPSQLAPTNTAALILNLPIAAYVPAEYIEDLSLRLQIYRRIGDLHTAAQVEAMRAELIDRFGKTPEAVEGLLYQIQVKLLAQRARATAITSGAGKLQIKLPYLPQIDRAALNEDLGRDVAVTRTAVEVTVGQTNAWQKRLLEVLELLAQREQYAGEAA